MSSDKVSIFPFVLCYIAVVPLERWDVDSVAVAPLIGVEARFGVTIQGAHMFDASAFGISRIEATYMDPQQRLLLQHASEVLWQKKMGSGDDGSNSISVLIGIGAAEYVNQTSALLPLGTYFATGGAVSVAAGR